MKEQAGGKAEAPERSQRGPRGYLMLGLAFLTCPCHVPILLAVLAGTSAGAYLQENLGLAAVALTGVFVISLLLGLQWVGSGEKAARK